MFSPRFNELNGVVSTPGMPTHFKYFPDGTRRGRNEEGVSFLYPRQCGIYRMNFRGAPPLPLLSTSLDNATALLCRNSWFSMFHSVETFPQNTRYRMAASIQKDKSIGTIPPHFLSFHRSVLRTPAGEPGMKSALARADTPTATVNTLSQYLKIFTATVGIAISTCKSPTLLTETLRSLAPAINAWDASHTTST